MVESIKELRKKYTAKKKNPDLTGVNKYLSVYPTKILLYTPISANQASLLFAVLGCIASLIFILGNVWYATLAALMLYVWTLGDYCDGSIARYRRKTGGLGTFFDWLNEHSAPTILFICISLGIYYQSNDIRVIVFGLSATFFWFLSYTFDHILEILYFIINADRSLLKKIKFSLSPKFSRLAIRMITRLSKFLNDIPEFKHTLEKTNIISSRFITKKKISRVNFAHLSVTTMSTIFRMKPKRKGLLVLMIWYSYLILGKILAHMYISYYIMFAAFLDLMFHVLNVQFKIFNLSFIYLVLIYFGILYPLLWVVKKIVNTMNF